MAFDVHIHVCFPCQDNQPVAALAWRLLKEMTVDIDDGRRAAVWFLEALSRRKGTNPGPKGGLSMWGMVGNYTPVDAFCEILRPFWLELLRDGVGGICQHERIIVFEEREQTEAATAYEIGLVDEDFRAGDAAPELFIKAHPSLPFSWRQY